MLSIFVLRMSKEFSKITVYYVPMWIKAISSIRLARMKNAVEIVYNSAKTTKL